MSTSGRCSTPDCTGTGLAAQAVSLFVRYLFQVFPLCKAGSLFRLEGVLHNHDYYAGRHWDKYLCAIYPDDVARDAAAATGQGVR